jgi:hypothetical protein
MISFIQEMEWRVELGILFNAHITAHYTVCDSARVIFPRYFLMWQKQWPNYKAVSDPVDLYVIFVVRVCVCVRARVRASFQTRAPDMQISEVVGQTFYLHVWQAFRLLKNWIVL